MIEVRVSEFTEAQIVEIVNCINNAKWDKEQDDALMAKTMADKPFETKYLVLKFDGTSYSLYYDSKGSSPLLKITVEDNTYHNIFNLCQLAFEQATTVDKPKFIDRLKKFYN